MHSVFVWTPSDLIGLGFMALFLLIALLIVIVHAALRAGRRIRRTFRNLWSRFNG